MIEFRKMHGLGNDFVVIDARVQHLSLDEEKIRHICDRRRGVGADTLVVIHPAKGEGDVFVKFYNADGSDSGACGNATRCVADIVLLETCREDCKIEIDGGVLRAWAMRGGFISVDMGKPNLEWQQIPLARDVDTLHLPLDGDPVAVNMGNPHCVFFVADNSVDEYVEKQGAAIEVHPLFPKRTNVEFVTQTDDRIFRQRTWERGVGMTQACGTGACAVAVSAMRRGLVDRTKPVQIDLDGGSLMIEWKERNDHSIMTGAVAYVFEGVWTAKSW